MPMLTCLDCGVIRYTKADAKLCAKCELTRRRNHHDAQWKQKLDELGFDFIQYESTEYRGSHANIRVTNRECGHTFVAKLNNILNRATICGICGPTKRAANALKHYVEKYGRDYDLTKWEDYRTKTRQLTEEVYQKNIDTLNPQRLIRGKADWGDDRVNLDHIIPIIYGFKNNLPPEIISDVRNLRIILARKNLSKKQKLTEEAIQLLKVLEVDYIH